LPENIQHSSHGNENHKTPTAATVEALGPDYGGLAGAEQPEQPEGRQREVPVVAALETIPPRDDVRGVAGGCGALTPASSAQKALHAKETRSMSTQSKKRPILLFYSRICRHYFLCEDRLWNGETQRAEHIISVFHYISILSFLVLHD